MIIASRALMISSKKERMVYDSGHDRLSELPLSIIQIILSSVSTKDAVRMSILSRQFRYIWTSLPHLVFDFSEFSSKGSMEKFVTNSLKLRKGPIHKFKMSVLLERSWPIVDEWLLFLPRNEIRELILILGSEDNDFCRNWHQVRSVVYSCNKLTHLELYRCKLGPPPLTFTGFLFLRCLILVDVYMSLKDVASIVANSPLLETLKLDTCYNSDAKRELRISAPNLKYFYLIGDTGDFMEIYFCAPLLAEICFTMKDDDYTIGGDYLQEENSSICNYTNFIGGCTSLEKLKGDFYFIKIFGFGIEFCRDSFVLHGLKVIELSDVNFEDVKEMSVVARLVTDSPNLQMLRLTFYKISSSKDEEDTSDVSYMDFFRAPNFKWEKLRTITLIDLTGLPSEIEFLKLLLENSPALERMNLRPDGLDSEEVKNLEELLKCNVAAPNFTLSFIP